MEINLISAEDLKARLDRGDDFVLCMTYGEIQFNGKHIPGSINVDTIEAGLEQLNPEDDIVVYCTNVDCPASRFAYQLLVDRGFKKVQRFAGGILEWEEKGYPLEGNMVRSASH